MTLMRACDVFLLSVGGGLVTDWIRRGCPTDPRSLLLLAVAAGAVFVAAEIDAYRSRARNR